MGDFWDNYARAVCKVLVDTRFSKCGDGINWVFLQPNFRRPAGFRQPHRLPLILHQLAYPALGAGCQATRPSK